MSLVSQGEDPDWDSEYEPASPTGTDDPSPSGDDDPESKPAVGPGKLAGQVDMD